MAYIVRNNLVSPIQQLYTFGNLEKKKLIVGLGNIGKDYDETRHNVGFMALDKVAEEFGVGFITKKDQKSLTASTQFNDTQIILMKPTTMMNLSGQAVQAVAGFYKIPVKDILVIHDELDLDYGDVRLKRGGGSAGHNGIKSIIEHLGENFSRVRIGIGPKSPEQIDAADFVLQDFSKAEQKKLPKLLTQVWAVVSDELKAPQE